VENEVDHLKTCMYALTARQEKKAGEESGKEEV
jgi:hypothetical protein